jgi:multiple sugar transport system permease protein
LLWSIANIATWAGAGFDMLIFIASLQTIPMELLEAARVDGASEWRIATRIKIRMIGPAVGLSAIFSVIGTLQLFTEPKVLASLSNAVSSHYTPNIYAYTQALVAGRYHYAAAVSVSLALITFVFSFAVLGFISKRGGLQ